MLTGADAHSAVCLTLSRAISRTRTVDEIYSIALDALASGLGVERSAILLFDSDGVMRFKAHRDLSNAYRRAVEGHSPWLPDTPDPQPIVVSDVSADRSLASYLPVLRAEGIAALAFIPLVGLHRVVGKFMLYYRAPHALAAEELQLAAVIAAQVSFAVERMRTEELARNNEERLRFALEAASMGTWDWDLTTNTVHWSENLERIHGLPPGTFDGTFASYEREIHPDDRERVLASARRAIAEGVPHDVEYRIVAPDGSIRWCEGKGRVEYDNGRPVRMTGVCMMVTRRKEAELARIALAEEASRLKDEFLATLSHELRTPLNAILGWVQMLQAQRVPAERVGRAIDVIDRNARLQAQLIQDILDVSRIITGKLDIDRVPVSVPLLIETALADATPAATAKRIAFDTDLAATLPLIEGDPQRLHQILGNVLSNAVKFTPEGGQITLRCAADDSRLIIEVRDSGTGISAEFLPYVFDRFRQADSRPARRHGGLGLGLAIARHLVEQHGGDICALSDGAGLGTTVRVRLPVLPDAPLQPTPASAAEPQPECRLEGVTTLVVDDQRDSCELLAALLELQGARVLLCGSAAEALAALRSTSVHVLVADIAMPDVDGYELMREVRALAPDTPAIAVTAYARPEDRHYALSAGYSAHCTKPIDSAAFLRTVRDVLTCR